MRPAQQAGDGDGRGVGGKDRGSRGYGRGGQIQKNNKGKIEKKKAEKKRVRTKPSDLKYSCDVCPIAKKSYDLKFHYIDCTDFDVLDQYNSLEDPTEKEDFLTANADEHTKYMALHGYTKIKPPSWVNHKIFKTVTTGPMDCFFCREEQE